MMTLLAFIVTIGVLVTIHEYGHFQVARWCGIRVLRFSIGFGQPLWKKNFGKDNTEFILAAIPLGGYVKMLDEREFDQDDSLTTKPDYTEQELSRAFNRKSVYQRIAVVLAGPLANLILAVILYWILFMMGVVGAKPIIGEITPQSIAQKTNLKSGDTIHRIDGQAVKTWQDARWLLMNLSIEKPAVEIETIDVNNNIHNHQLNFGVLNADAEVDILDKLGMQMAKPVAPAIIGEILPDSVASKSGFLVGDKIVSIDKVMINDWEKVVTYVKDSPNKQLVFQIERNHQLIKVLATPESYKENGKTVGRLGASVKLSEAEFNKLLIQINYTPLKALQKAVVKTWETAVFSLKMLGNMIVGKVSWKGISGPISIASYAGESANMGLKVFLGFLALVSISIGVLNLLPIPMLDGGHLLYYIAEIFRGAPVSEQVMITGQKIGIGLLGLLMVIAIFNDINRYLIG